MIQSLPFETVLEAQARARRQTLLLLGLMLGVYFCIFLAMGYCAAYLTPLHLWLGSPKQAWLKLSATAFAVAVLGGVFHYIAAALHPVEKLLSPLRAQPPDPEDRYHRVFLDLISEMEAASGLRPIQAVVVPSPGMNAFSVQDRRGRCVIGVTEGLLSSLKRQELAAVLCHETCHLLHHDSRLATFSCALVGVFSSLADASLVENLGGPSGRGHRESPAGLSLAVWLLAQVGRGITLLAATTLSRQREYLADAHAVKMCNDPMALAEALYKIARLYRGGMELPEGLSALFIASPQHAGLDDQEGFVADLFSTHPPMRQRLDKILHWAKADLASLQTLDEAASSPTPPGAGTQAWQAPQYYAYGQGQWAGPFLPEQLMALGLSPQSWVCQAGTQNVCQAAQEGVLLALLEQGAAHGGAPQRCPRCKLPLLPKELWGAEALQCSFCQGLLLKNGVLERVLARGHPHFSEQELNKASQWRDAQRGPLGLRQAPPETQCPYCQSAMGRALHSVVTQVVVERCQNPDCRALWCEGGQLELMEELLADAQAQVRG